MIIHTVHVSNQRKQASCNHDNNCVTEGKAPITQLNALKMLVLGKTEQCVHGVGLCVRQTFICN